MIVLRRLRLAVAVAFLSVAATVIPTPDVNACSCARTPGPCIALDEAPVVFVGLVTSVEKKAETARAHFRVEERVRGIDSAAVDVDTTTATSCGYWFKSGTRYLVYAWPLAAEDAKAMNWPSRAPAHVSTGACSRTRLLEAGGDDVDLLRAKSQGRPLTRAFGTLRVMPEAPNQTPPPVLGGIVVASSPAGRFEAKTDAAGRYRFENLPAGSYTLTATWPTGYRDLFGRRDITQIEIAPPVCGVERDFWSEIDAKK